METITYRIKKIRYRDEATAFTIAEVEIVESFSKTPTTEPIVQGIIPLVQVGDIFEGTGDWEYNKVYNYSFKLISNLRIWETSLSEIQNFLQRNVKGLGKAKSKAIVDKLGIYTLSEIYKDIAALSDIKGLGGKNIKKVYDMVREHKDVEDAIVFLVSHGASYHTAFKIYQKHGMLLIQKAKKNPYALQGLKEIDFPEIDAIGYNLNFDFLNIERLKAGFLYYIEEQTIKNGSLYVESFVIRKEITNFLLKNGSFKSLSQGISQELYLTVLKELKEQNLVIETQNENKEIIYYLPTVYYTEEKLVALIKERLKGSQEISYATSFINTFVDEFEKSENIKLAKKQKDALCLLNEKISILTGGPGTGKTQTLNTMIACIRKRNPQAKLVLAAPTGIASKRMSLLTNEKAKTLHSTFELKGLNLFSTDFEIEADYVFVDEFSMVDVFLAYKLLHSLSSDAKLVIIGDYDQLPSVGPGLILKDFINSKVIPMIRLDEVFRQAQDSQIVQNAYKVLAGSSFDNLSFDEKKGDAYFISRSDIKSIQHTLIKSVQRFLQKGNSINDIVILTPKNIGDLGTRELNRIMQSHFNPAHRTKREIKVNHFLFRLGDKVIQTKNNKFLEVSNGEIGIITDIGLNEKGNESIEVSFSDDKYVSYETAHMSELELAYVITAHKSQGSEYNIVLMPFHKSHSNMLDKNLLYTAFTRTKKTLVCIGDEKSLHEGMQVIKTNNRKSMIRSKLEKL